MHLLVRKSYNKFHCLVDYIIKYIIRVGRNQKTNQKHKIDI